MSSYKFPEVTLLVVHYNRSSSLERNLSAFRSMGVEFGGIVVSDDASKPEHIERLKQLRDEYGFTLVTTPLNGGLGNNNNKGQDAVKTPYTLYAQEDFHSTPAFPERFSAALEIIKRAPAIDIVRLYAGVKYPYRESYCEGFSELRFSLLRPGTSKFFCYSDWPHLRRSNFFQKFGRYAEGIPAIKTEKGMVMSFLQAGGRVLQVDVDDVFVHENTTEEPSTQDYSTFLRIKKMIPPVVFDTLWTAKLTAEFYLKSFRA